MFITEPKTRVPGMTTILPPDLSVTFIAALVIPLIIGFLVGVIAKTALKLGIAIVVIILILIAVGIISPTQVIQPLMQLIRSGPSLESKVAQIAGYLPYSSITFILGFVMGLFKG
jgi:uncharacterized membrane protein (Fun14 family)